jgi:hypothetical protein
VCGLRGAVTSWETGQNPATVVALAKFAEITSNRWRSDWSARPLTRAYTEDGLNLLLAPSVPGDTEVERMDNAARRVSTVSKEELKRREVEWQWTQAKKPLPSKRPRCVLFGGSQANDRLISYKCGSSLQNESASPLLFTPSVTAWRL